MILAIGIDTTDIHRFEQWHTLQPSSLARVFTPREIAYCLAVTSKSAERFAVRFAAKEACYKALCSAFPILAVPFIKAGRHIEITPTNNNAPRISADSLFEHYMPFERRPQLLLSLTHTKNTATAVVLVQ